jgi:Methyl-accepting chemotaxis protein (MCP) signalling domain
MGLTNWFRGLRLKLLLMIFFPVMMIGILSFLAISEVGNIMVSLKESSLGLVPRATFTGEMGEYSQKLGRAINLAIASNGNKKEMEIVKNFKRESLEGFERSMNAYEEISKEEKIKELFKPVPIAFKDLKIVADEVIANMELNTQQSRQDAYELSSQKYRPIAAKIEQILKEMKEIRNQSTKVTVEESINSAEHSRIIVITICSISIGLLVIFGVILVYTLANTLSGISYRISASGKQVAEVSEQLSNASQTLSSGVNEAASSLEETVASLEELSSMVKQNADNAKEAGALSQSARGAAEEGEREIKELIIAMNDISHSSKKIEDIINVIDDIAFQTNLLALNAAVEAARAGEQGKGFAVVADAVRNLAQRSASAAKDITNLIKDSVSKVERGSQIGEKSGVVLKNIVTSVAKVADLNGEISIASQEQANGIAQIGQAMNQLDQATQGNAASAEEAAAASEEMSAEAHILEDEMRTLILIIEGNTVTENLNVSQHHLYQNKKKLKDKIHSANQFKQHQKLKLTRANRIAKAAEEAIPFSDEKESAKISNTSGF